MKNEKIQRLILLEQSGELSWWGRRRLSRYLHENPAARHYQREAEQLTRAVREDEPGAGVPDFTMTRILDEAKRELSGPPAPRATAPAWKPALAFCGLALLVTAGWLVFTRAPSTIHVAEETAPPAIETPAWDDHLDEDIAELGALVATFSEEETDLYSDLDTLAEELMTLEDS